MSELRFDTYYRYADLTTILNDLAAQYPTLCRVSSIGKSYEGRDIWLATLTNTATGADTDKPAFWADANIHATEVSPSSCALYAIHKYLTGYGTDPHIARLLDTRVLYIVPRFNPDGAELFLDERHRRVRSSTRPYPRLDEQDGLYEADVDGDGRTLMMRVKDPNGAWKAHPDELRLLIPRAADGSDSGPFYRLLPEGLIRNHDGVTIKIAPALEGLDLNRNFPWEWALESDQRGAGPYPTSEPEVRAVVQFIVDHPNICGALTFHTYSGVYLRPYSNQADDIFPPADLRVFKELGQHATRLTGYPAISIYHDFRYSPKQFIKGVFGEWMYDHLGVFSFTCELWSPLRQAGIEFKPEQKNAIIDWYTQSHPVEDDLKLLKWSDEQLGGQGYVNWYAAPHPQLGEVELGGWNNDYAWRNPPPHLLAKEIAPHADFILFHALVSPLLEFSAVTVTALGHETFHIRAVVQNSGWLPTHVSQRALDKKLVRPVEVTLALPEGATLVSGELRAEVGQLAGRALKQSTFWNVDPTDDRAKVEWVIRAPAGSEVTITAAHQRAGKITRTVKLEE
ncbi:MAG: M14 family metallopeptidase [Anaerolineales bacterium]